MTTTWVGNRNVLVATDAITGTCSALYNTFADKWTNARKNLWKNKSMMCI